MSLELVSSNKCFNGIQKVYKHFSSETNCCMNFAIYLPSAAEGEKLHCLFFILGNACSEQDLIEKSGFQRFASQHRLIVVGPDTSPRGLKYAETGEWNFGDGAGYTIDALMEPWSRNFKMYSYVTKELPKIIKENFPVSGTFGIMGHSVGGGFGAICIGLRNPDMFKSISALAPFCNPTASSLTCKFILEGYLGRENKDKWPLYDAVEMVKAYNGPKRDILVDQGRADQFLPDFLMTENLQASAATKKDVINLRLNMRDGFNHLFYFVSTFIGEHLDHHAKILNSMNI